MNQVPDELLDYDEDLGVYTFNGEPFTGLAFQSGPGGWIRSDEEYRDGLPWGVSRTWHSSTQLASESRTVGGVWHGPRREWHPTGQLALEEELEFGIALRRRRWDESGAIVEDFLLLETDPNYETLLMFRKHNPRYRWTEP
ncbi:toxin-antitoxin system YwqK family antitoxin [Tuwongella immobilis]|uniref:Uncharacterized protein n=1 Tax=Tuwongella immobilis TaxID=692036 RepID=A0A6C2YSJ8_9BACT|nr:hypothetical protein [Tuwongella immobilis]VIP04351.1 Putative uncharacterized protein OS=Brevibacillus brevis (strain 47 / JCM 6285 / NBRC 100599) GN=BBR47_44650 PE=4 SV=1 [Tuwongella immobilis]VTS06064.1 Putative uncharacterized protein OS=Brevibacillus brevis (strain 47 / JCM 6285 / NBRC 100599) GN=BBR47_44650 PE=4 SV=1 [Tuwongella immobilis]